MQPVSSPSEPLLRVEGLSKQFGAFWALREVSFDVRAGEFISLFGPNGAGKTTLMRIVAMLSKPTAGGVWLNGASFKAARTEARRELGFVSHQPLLYPDLTAEENLAFFARLYSLDQPRERIRSLLDRVGLSHRADDPVRQFSRGMQQRLALARALLHGPRLFLFDEPYTGLDPVATDWLTRLLGDLAGQGQTVLITSHDLERGAALASRAFILAGGRLVYEADAGRLAPGELAAAYRDASAQALARMRRA